MSNTLRAPSPSLVERWTVYEQLDYSMPRGIIGKSNHSEFVGALKVAIGDTCHRFGVAIQYGRIWICGDVCQVSVNLVAGNWNGQVKFKGTISKRPTARVCAKILRLLESDNEHLG